jgi:hypothetical protein
MLAFATVYVHFFSCPSHGLMGHRVDHISLYHFISEPPEGPSLMPFRSLATIQGDHMGFVIAGALSTLSIGHRFARQSRFKTCFNKTLLELLDFCGGYFIRRSNVGVCPPTGSLSLA